jgi:hypothetical protein
VDIRDCAKGLATFGTPHDENALARFASILTEPISLLFEISAPYLQILRNKGAFVEAMNHAFEAYRGKIFITSFYETEDEPLLNRVVGRLANAAGVQSADNICRSSRKNLLRYRTVIRSDV